MWLMLNDSFLSIVAVPKRPNVLLVRGRREGDIERVFPGYPVHQSALRDYAFRAFVPAKRVKRAIAAEVDRIDYTNFKNSVTEQDRHDAYLDVWTRMLQWGNRTGRSTTHRHWREAYEPAPEETPEPG